MNRFSKPFVVTVAFILVLIAILLFLYHQNGHLFNFKSSNQSEDQSEIDAAQSMKKEGLIMANTDFILQQTEKPEMIVLGRTFNAKYSDLAQLVSQTSGSLIQFITQNKLIIKGALMCVYNEVPNTSGDMEIFVGIPVNKVISQTVYTIRKLKGGKYHKVTANAELGKGAPTWKLVCSDLEKSGQKITFPIFEYPSDSRNSEMTTVISQSNLLIPVSK